jgi:hypothetical protein
VTVPLYAVLVTALYYLGFWAKITESIWSRYPAKLATFMGCAACSGFWYGALLTLIVGRITGWGYLGLPWHHPLAPLLAGLVALVTTPPLAALHLHALDAISHRGAPQD